jgi:hypothetical protein
MTTRRIAAVLSVVLSTAGAAHAALKTTDKGAGLVRDQFPEDQRPGFDRFVSKCGACHPLSRPIGALVTGQAPLTGAAFDRDGIKKYVVQMARKPNSGIDRDDAKIIIEFLAAARELAAVP